MAAVAPPAPAAPSRFPGVTCPRRAALLLRRRPFDDEAVLSVSRPRPGPSWPAMHSLHSRLGPRARRRLSVFIVTAAARLPFTSLAGPPQARLVAELPDQEAGFRSPLARCMLFSSLISLIGCSSLSLTMTHITARPRYLDTISRHSPAAILPGCPFSLSPTSPSLPTANPSCTPMTSSISIAGSP